MDAVLQRPWTEEAEDYARYKRHKKDVREKRHEATRKVTETRPGFLLSGSDGTADVQPWSPDSKDSVWCCALAGITKGPRSSMCDNSNNFYS
jgi:hypothetical protein